MRASADIIWRTFQTFHDNDDLDSLASEEEEEELSSEDFESGEDDGEGRDSRIDRSYCMTHTPRGLMIDRIGSVNSWLKASMLIMLNS